jgi:hypothetical protein
MLLQLVSSIDGRLRSIETAVDSIKDIKRELLLEQWFVVYVLHLDHYAVISYPLFVFSIHQSLLILFLFGQIAYWCLVNVLQTVQYVYFLLDTDCQTIPNRNVTRRNIKIVIGKSEDLWL